MEKLSKENKQLILEFFKLYTKTKTNSKLNLCDKKLIDILEEYNHYLEYKELWSIYND